MAVVAPFRGITYNFSALGDPCSLMAPPYDVISEEEQEEYYRLHPNNVIRLELGKRKKGDTDWDNRYTRSADCFKRWQSEDVLLPSEHPCMYLTSLSFDPGDGGGPRERWGLIALVHIEEDGSGVILPHERTFSAHKDDRLRLLRACGAQFSPIFSLYEDSGNRVRASLRETVEAPPDVSFEFRDGTRHRVWIVQQPSVLREIAKALRDQPIFIADGHHRYETSRNFRNFMRTRHGSRPANRSYEFVMMNLTSMDDPGLTILPSHRLIRKVAGFDPEGFLREAGRWFEVIPVMPTGPGAGPDPLLFMRLLEEKGRNTSAIGFHHHGMGLSHVLVLRPEVRDDLGEDLHPSLKKLDVLVLSRLIFRKILGFSDQDMDDERLFHYQSLFANALAMVDSGAFQMTFLLNHTRIEQVREVASNLLIMPRKSTYFFPKALTGLVFYKVDPYERIELF